MSATALLLALTPLVHAADLDITIDAVVDTKLGAVRGLMHVDTKRSIRLVNPLEQLPEPPDDLNLFRTYPGAPSHGIIRWSRVDEDTWRFYTILPKRYGAIGSTRHHGLFANGAWYPQPMTTEGMPIVEWDVSLTLPDGAHGALGDTTGLGELTWRGSSERVSLAVLPRGRLTPLPGTEVTLLTRGRPGRRLQREVKRTLARLESDGAWSGTVVEAPLRRRLARPGVGLAYVSDRAFRVTPGLERVHRSAVARAMVQSFLSFPDPFVRELTAATLIRVRSGALRRGGARDMVKWARWLPAIDAILNNQRVPFWGDIFEAVHPADPVQDDLIEILQPHTPGTVVAAQIEDSFGLEGLEVVASALGRGESLWGAANLAGIPRSRIESFQQPYPVQDYRLEVERSPPTVTITRDAPPTAVPETIVVQVDDERRAWTTTRGPDTIEIDLSEPPKRIVLDPDSHIGQSSRLGDRWPATYVVTAAAWINTIQLTRGFADAFASTWIRRRYDTHNTFSVAALTNQETLLDARIGYTRKAGPLQDGFSRPHRFNFWVGGSAFNARFADVTDGRFAIGGGASWSWDTRVDYFFPLEGHALRVSVDGGFVPTSDRWWARARASATALTSPHPRHVIAVSTRAGIARGEVDHRLLSFGGESAMRSLPPTALVSSRQGVLLAEYRWALLRNASIPLGILWGSELQISGGAELGGAWHDEKWVAATGVTAGVSIVADTLGADPFLMGVTLGWSVWDEGLDIEHDSRPEILLRWAQAF